MAESSSPQALTFTFNHTNLDDLLKEPATKNIVFSVCTIPGEEEGEREMYLAAQAYDNTGKPVTKSELNKINGVKGELDAALGCPSPPPWNDDAGTIEHASLVFAPRFAISAQQLKTSLGKNVFLLDNEDNKPAIPLLQVDMAAKINTAQMLASFISIKIQTGKVSKKFEPLEPVTLIEQLSAEAF